MPTNNPIPSYDPSDLLFNAAKLDEVVNSTASSYTDRMGVDRRTLKSLEDEFPNAAENAAAAAASASDAANEAASAASAVDAANAEATAAQAARTGAEAARDAALIQAGVYVDEPTGRAAVADGTAFKVQGSGGVAAYEYRRVNASSSTPIATYPSKAAYDYAIGPKKNLFNPADSGVQVGFAINGATGAVIATAGFRATGFIPVSAGIAYAISHRRAYAWYDVNKAFISGNEITDASAVVATSPASAAFFRIGISDGNLPAFQIEKGSVHTSYEAYQLALNAPMKDSSVTTPTIADAAVTSSKISNGAVVASKIAPGAVTTEKILAGSVYPRSASFFELSKNLFDKAASTIGYYIGNDGVLVQSASYVVSDFIPITVGSTYALSVGAGSGVRFTCYYDANKAFIAGGKSSSIDGAITSLTAPAGVAYVRVTVAVPSVDTFQFELGAAATAYEPFGRLKPDYIKPIETANIADGAVTLEKTAFAVQSKNLFNKATVTADKYVSNLDGLLYDNTAYYTSDFIPVVEGLAYSLSYSSGTGVRFTCYFNASKQFVAGGANTNVGGFTAPAGAAFVRVTIFKNTLDAFQMELGSVATAYQQFGYVIDPNLLPSQPEPTNNTVVPEIVAPPYVYAVQGRECNVYIDNLHLSDAKDWLHNFDAAISGSQQQNERWTWTPTEALASGALSVAVHDKTSGALVSSKTMQQRAAASDAGTGLTKKVLVIGDSLINAGVITQTLLDIAATDAMKVTLLGTRSTTSASNRHEGRGGWSFQTYATNYTGLPPYGLNPFWIGGSVNFPQYLIDNAIETPDWVPIHLGINDAFSYTSDAAVVAATATAFGYADTLIASIKAAGAGVKVALMIPPPPSSDQDAFASSYGTGQTRWRHKRNILILARELIAKYAGQEANRIYLVPSNTALDTVNNMSRWAASPVNSRNTAVTVARQADGVHPASTGYQQMGDALWAFLKYYA